MKALVVAGTLWAGFCLAALGQGAFTIGGGLDPDDPGVASQFTDPYSRLVEAEYYVGTDPGAGNGVEIVLDAGDGLAAGFDSVVVPADLEAGTYDVGVRVRDAAGRWSNPLLRRFAVKDYTFGGGITSSDPEAATKFAKTYEALVEAEYFVGEDPGEGNGVEIVLDAGDGLAAGFDSVVVPADLGAGTYDVGVRVRDAAGRWSNALLRRFTVKDYTFGGGITSSDPEAATKFAKTHEALVEAEYFVGEDPGEGNGVEIVLDAGDGLAKAFGEVLVPADLEVGTYDVGVRVRDEAGRWSNALLRRFTVKGFTVGGGIDPDDPEVGTKLMKPFEALVEAEYFVGADPGEGNGVPLVLEGGESLSKSIGTVALGLDMPGGTYDVGLRVKDEAGRWSNALLRRFNLYSQEVLASQRAGTKLVDLGFDLIYGPLPYTVTVLISADGGRTWSVPNGSLTGDIGDDVEPGPSKEIVWHAGEDWDGGFSEDMRFRVIAYRTEQVLPSGFVAVGEGTFTQGSPNGETGRENDERAREVFMEEPFYVAQTEVTWSQWNAVRDRGVELGYDDLPAGQSGSDGGGGGSHPVTDLSWVDAVKWCNLKSEIEGRRPVYYSSEVFVPENAVRSGIPEVWVYRNADGYRLPTEAEWEFACRAGTDTAFSSGAITDATVEPNLDGAGWYAANSGGAAQAVGGKAANAWGLKDMHGNVREWCEDSYAPYVVGPVWNPLRDGGALRAVRGGSYGDDAAGCRSAARDSTGQNSRAADLGFRLVLNYQGLSVLENGPGSEFGAVVDARDPMPGNLLGGRRPAIGGEVMAMAVQADGRVLIGGEFVSVAGVARSNVARLNADGTLDETFNPGADFAVFAIAVQEDGGILLGGEFASMAGGPANYLARLFPDGTIDPTFRPAIDFTVTSVAVQGDGRILIGGDFTSVNGVPSFSVARLWADGNVDEGFVAEADWTVRTIAVQSDGKILIGGNFGTVNGQFRDRIARLEADGELDGFFDPGADDEVSAIVVQPDGKILVGGRFTLIGGQFRTYLARLSRSGFVEGFYQPDPDDWVNSLALQADGQLIVGGNFGGIGGEFSPALARLDPGGVVDPLFVHQINGPVNAVAIEGDGQVVFGGLYSSVSGVARGGMAWLDNGPVEELLQVASSDRVRWTRGGSAPETAYANFELSTDGGATWLPLGSGRSSRGRWELVRINLPAEGLMRAWGRASGGQSSTSSGVIEETVAFSGLVTVPEISVAYGEGEEAGEVPRGGSVDLGAVTVGSGRVFSFRVRNLGYGDLLGVAASLDGFNAVDYTIETVPAAEVSGPSGETALTVRFRPGDIGEREATLRIANNDTDENPYTIQLSGRGVIAGQGDETFLPLVAGEVAAMAVQPDGRVVIGGDFAQVGGQARSRIARLWPDGTVEEAATFAAGSGANGRVNCVAVQADGGVLLGGAFTSVSSQLRNRLARLLPGGVLEATATFNPGTGADGEVRGLAVQPDGQIVVVGAFSEVNGRALAGVARLHPNGTVEAVETFDVGLGANGRVNCVALQDDGKLVIGGVFTEVAGVGRAGLARLNGDGSLDLGFAPVVDGEVDAVVVDEEGRIVVAGDFAGIDGQARGRIARLLADGTVESTDTFDVGVGADGRVRSVALQADGSLVIGGDFAQVGGQLRGRVARLFDNGTVESTITFDSGVGADGVVNGVAIAADGGILLGGGFGSFGGVAGGSFARVHNAVGEAELLVVDAGEVRWNRDGTAPQLSGVGFEWSADGQAPWSEIGGVERWEDGWRARGLSLPNVGVVRARGRASGGEGGGSSGMSEVVGGYVNAPAVVTVGASDVTANGAKVYAAVDPNGEAEVYFEFGFDEAFGQRSEGQVLSGVGVFDVQSLLTGLVGNSTYRYRAVAETSGGVYVGDTLTLVTAPEPPLVTTGNPTEVSGVGATFVGAVNPRGRPVEVFFEWGATTLYGNTTEVQMVEAGTAAVDVFAPVSGLTPDQVYHYRIVATGSGGTAIGSDVSFEADAGGEAVALPVVVTGDAVDRQTGGATLYATVNPQGGFTSAYFEYGETDAYGSVTPVLGAGNGNSEASLFSVVKGLAPGRDYHYRVVAANSLGTSMGEDVMFSTRFLPPAVTTGGAESVSTTSIRVAGVVRANDAATQVSFEYGTDGVSFPAAVAGVPATVTGDVEVSVEAELINLSQGVTYHYRIRGENSGGVSFGGAGTFTMDILSGLAQVFPGAPPEAAGEVTVEIEPAGIGAGWRFLGEGEWRAPGETVSGLVTGEREIEYRPVPGFLQPLRDVAAVVSGGDPLLIERRYYESEEDGSGGVSVVLLPEAISDPGVAEPERAQWRLAGEDDTMWRDSGVVLEGLVPGSYLIECKEIAGRDEPKPSSVLVADGETGLVTLTYSLESVRSGAGPEVLDFATVSAGTAWPYGWVGQLRSNAGLATGTVVKPRVVLTAGHVVFDDGTLSPAVGLEWMHQRDRGAFEPAPQEPRGYYLFTGYAAQREAEDTPGVSSPQSQNLDVATLYFPEDAGRGGYSGFLASDLPENEFLMSDADKTLVGYPVDGIAAAGRGRMHATPVMDVEFTPGFGRTYSTEAIWSVGGNSGGPLCVQHEGGSYYPAAVYLGGTGQTVVRAIDSEVIDLIGRAEVSGGGGENNTGGGITHTTTTKFGPSGAPGALKVTLSPSAARSAGARWRLGSGSWRRSGDQLAGLRAGTYTMRLSTVDGYESPSSQAVKINGGQLRTVVFTYEEEAPTITRLEAWRLANYGSASNSGSGGDRANGDGDEFDNVAEWGFGLDPHAPDGNPVSATVNEAGNVEVTLPQLEVRSPPSYEIWVSENQSSWVMVNPELDVRSIVDVPGPTEMVTYEYTGTMGADGKLFVRVRIRE